MRVYKKKPQNLGVFLGKADYGDGYWKVYNKLGHARFAKKTKYGDYLVTDKHIGAGYMLKQLNVEFSATGDIFKHYTLPKKEFRKANLKKIIKLQRSVG